MPGFVKSSTKTLDHELHRYHRHRRDQSAAATACGSALPAAGRPGPGIRHHRIVCRRFHERAGLLRSEEHTSELQSLMRISYAVFCLKKKNKRYQHHTTINLTRRIQR